MAGQKFDILPDISAEDRDLRFRQVENSAPATLTPGQIAHFNEPVSYTHLTLPTTSMV